MFQADDERSDTDDDMESADSTLDGNGGPISEPRYPGEDTRPTSSKELAGWYAYAFAAEVYVICG
jgi:UMF1 family MFS transporter